MAHTGPPHLLLCVKNIKSTSTLPHMWHMQGPYTCRCASKILNLQVHSCIHHTYRAPTPAGVWKILNLQVHSHNVAHTGPPHLQMRIKNIESTSMSETCSTYRAVCQKYWIYKYTPTPTTHTGLGLCVKNIESTSTLPHLPHIHGPNTCKCAWKILYLQVHSHIFRCA